MANIVANIVTYHPDLPQLEAAVERLLQQVQSVLIVNNSRYDIFLESERTVILNLGQNLGIARAQTIAMEKSFEQGADFVLQMDQDSIPDAGMTQQLLSSYKQLQEQGISAGLIGPQDYDRITGYVSQARLHKGQYLPGLDLLDVSAILSSGSLIPRHTFELIGGMADELFIDAVDHEYCWRARAKGLPVIKDPKALLGHRLGNGQTRILGLLTVGVPSPFRHYYSVRNVFLLMLKSHVPLSWKMTSLLKIGFKLISYPLFLDQGGLRFKFIVKGILHGLSGKSGPMV